MIRRPPRSTLFPSTTLSRSAQGGASMRHHLIALVALMALAAPAAAQTDDGIRLPVDPGENAKIRVNTLDTLNVVLEPRSEEHTSELQSRQYLVCRLLLEKKK